MNQFLEAFLSWVFAEMFLSGILFFIYFLFVRKLRNSTDRFNFLLISFLALLFLPWVPSPVLSEPIFRNFISDLVMIFGKNRIFGKENWVSPLLSAAGVVFLPLAYFSILSFRIVRVIYSLKVLHEISGSETKYDSLSEFPIIAHEYSLPPMTVGVFKPKILISKNTCESLSQPDLEMVVQHEEEHIHRGDGISNGLRIFVREVLFFSPFIWFLAHKFEEEMELSVDAALIARPYFVARSYGSLLLRMADLSYSQGRHKNIGPFLSNSGIKTRLLAMKLPLQGRSKFFNGVALGVFLLLGLFAGSFFGTPAYSAASRSEARDHRPIKKKMKGRENESKLRSYSGKTHL